MTSKGRYSVRESRREPLWDRVDRNRVRLAVLLVSFFVGTSIALAVLLALTMAIALVWIASWVVEVGPTMAGALLGLYPWALVSAGVAVLGYMAWALGRDERWFAKRLGATLVPTGDLLPVKYALKDMAIASGMPCAPALYVLDTPNVNAFVYAKGRRRAIVGVTRGFVDRLEVDEQRAVFANLLARLKAGDMLPAAAITALMSPLWRVYEMPLGDNEGPKYVDTLDLQTGQWVKRPAGAEAFLYSPSIALPVFAISTVFVVLSEFIVFGHRFSQLHAAEAADAEGMLLLKDPRSMLHALEKVVRFNNYVPTAGPGMGQLFYAWTGEGSTDDEDDVENERVARLREVLGVEGMEPPVIATNEAILLVAPPAPRLDREP